VAAHFLKAISALLVPWHKNAIQPSALGERNWLFIGHPEAGGRSAAIYSLLGS
jgi:hypothetical protein